MGRHATEKSALVRNAYGPGTDPEDPRPENVSVWELRVLLVPCKPAGAICRCLAVVGVAAHPLWRRSCAD